MEKKKKENTPKQVSFGHWNTATRSKTGLTSINFPYIKQVDTYMFNWQRQGLEYKHLVQVSESTI